MFNETEIKNVFMAVLAMAIGDAKNATYNEMLASAARCMETDHEMSLFDSMMSDENIVMALVEVLDERS